MSIDQNTLILVLVISIPIYFIFFVCGYLVGKTSSLQYLGSQSNSSKTISSKDNKKLSSISIDEKKIVTDININGMEKKYVDIAVATESNETISGSIDKLKNLKK